MSIRWQYVLLSLTVAACAPSVTLAQGRGATTLGLGGGYSNYDLSGTGSTFVVTARVDHMVLSPLMLEFTTTYFQYEPQLSNTTDRLLFPELSVQGQVRVGPVFPYLGGGAGIALVVSGSGSTELTLHGAAGLRLRVQGQWGTRIELRVRTVDPWAGTTADITLGLSRTF